MGNYTELRLIYPRTWRIWYRMNRRCEIPEPAYEDVEVCDDWSRLVSGEQGFVNFVDDMGSAEQSQELCRIDMFGNYTPSNTEWITDRCVRQARYRIWSTEYGQLLKYAKSIGIHKQTFWEWAKAGHDLKKKIKEWQKKYATN